MMTELMTTTTEDDEGDSQDGDGDGYEEADRSGGANLTVLKFKRKVIAETNSAKNNQNQQTCHGKNHLCRHLFMHARNTRYISKLQV